MKLISYPGLCRADSDITGELDQHGFWDERLDEVTVWLVPLGVTAYGWQWYWYGSTGDICIPRVALPRIADRVLKRPRMPLRECSERLVERISPHASVGIPGTRKVPHDDGQVSTEALFNAVGNYAKDSGVLLAQLQFRGASQLGVPMVWQNETGPILHEVRRKSLRNLWRIDAHGDELPGASLPRGRRRSCDPDYEKAGREADAEALREEAAKRKAEQEKKAAPKDEGKTPEPAKDKPPLAEDE